MSRALSVLIALLSLGGVARAETPTDSLFRRANEAYLKGDYGAAIDAYEQVAAAGVNHEDLHYNLGNAYVQADRLGPAIYHYELALGLDPAQEDARFNLQHVRDAASKRFGDKLLGEERRPAWMRALASMTLGGLTLSFLGVYMAMFALAVTAWVLSPGFLRVAVVAMLVFAFIGSVGTGGLLAGRWYLATRVQQGVVLPDEVAVKEGPEANYQTSFLVHAGLKVRIVEHDDDWVRVRLSNGLEGWTRERDIGRL